MLLRSNHSLPTNQALSLICHQLRGRWLPPPAPASPCCAAISRCSPGPLRSSPHAQPIPLLSPRSARWVPLPSPRARRCQREGVFPFTPCPQRQQYYNFNALLISPPCLVSAPLKASLERAQVVVFNLQCRIVTAVQKYNLSWDKLKERLNENSL